MTETVALLVPALASALLHFLWQGALLGLVAWLALAALRDARPQARYAVAGLALLACAVLPAWNLLQALSGQVLPRLHFHQAREIAQAGAGELVGNHHQARQPHLRRQQDRPQRGVRRHPPGGVTHGGPPGAPPSTERRGRASERAPLLGVVAVERRRARAGAVRR